jgi:hypothetical protein
MMLWPAEAVAAGSVVAVVDFMAAACVPVASTAAPFEPEATAAVPFTPGEPADIELPDADMGIGQYRGVRSLERPTAMQPIAVHGEARPMVRRVRQQ